MKSNLYSEIEAYQWSPQLGESEGVILNPTNNPMLSKSFYVHTIHGYIPISNGDWVVRDKVNGAPPYWLIFDDATFKLLYDKKNEANDE